MDFSKEGEKLARGDQAPRLSSGRPGSNEGPTPRDASVWPESGGKRAMGAGTLEACEKSRL